MKTLSTGCALLLASAWSATVAAMTCTIGSVSGLAFGNYNVFDATPRDTAGSISYTCSDVGGASIVIQLDQGNAATFFPRTLLDGAFVLEYNIYLDAARTSVWGDGSSGTSQHGPVVPDEGVNSVNVFGRIEAGQNARAGSYSDTVVVTIVF